MAFEFKLPDLGEGIHEGEIVDVVVKPGDTVAEGDPLMEVETDKAVTAIPSPFTGVVTEVRVAAGDTVHVGDVLIVFEGSRAAGIASEEAAAGKRASSKEAPAVGPPTPTRAEPTMPPHGKEAQGRHPPVPASPATRRLAREMRVDLHAVHPSGPEGLVTAEDVRRHAQDASRSAKPESEGLADAGDRSLPGLAVNLPDFSQWGPVETEPLRSVRKAMARQMALSWSQIPHVSNLGEADVTDLLALRARHAPQVARDGGRLTLTVFAAKAAVAALKRFPRFNASLDMAGQQIIYKRYFNVGIAVDSPRGLIVPVLRHVDRKSVRELAMDFQGLVARARAGETSLEELQGGTFTITNAGAVGGGHFAPIINFPQVAILGMGRAALKPVVRANALGDPEIVPRHVMPLVLSFDHRIADGAEAIRLMETLRTLLEDPETMLLDV
jgi:pyruvate dehydrogenase E2 component (dihydrolipoamide acetyltransferase)